MFVLTILDLNAGKFGNPEVRNFVFDTEETANENVFKILYEEYFIHEYEVLENYRGFGCDDEEEEEIMEKEINKNKIITEHANKGDYKAIWEYYEIDKDNDTGKGRKRNMFWTITESEYYENIVVLK
jgi:hypothetical protein